MGQTVSLEIASGLASAEDVDVTELDVAIENHVSTDAIQFLVNHPSDSWRLQFETPNHVVEVTGNDAINVDGERIGTF